MPFMLPTVGAFNDAFNQRGEDIQAKRAKNREAIMNAMKLAADAGQEFTPDFLDNLRGQFQTGDFTVDMVFPSQQVIDFAKDQFSRKSDITRQQQALEQLKREQEERNIIMNVIKDGAASGDVTMDNVHDFLGKTFGDSAQLVIQKYGDTLNNTIQTAQTQRTADIVNRYKDLVNTPDDIQKFPELASSKDAANIVQQIVANKQDTTIKSVADKIASNPYFYNADPLTQYGAVSSMLRLANMDQSDENIRKTLSLVNGLAGVSRIGNVGQLSDKKDLMNMELTSKENMNSQDNATKLELGRMSSSAEIEKTRMMTEAKNDGLIMKDGFIDPRVAPMYLDSVRQQAYEKLQKDEAESVKSQSELLTKASTPKGKDAVSSVIAEYALRNGSFDKSVIGDVKARLLDLQQKKAGSIPSAQEVDAALAGIPRNNFDNKLADATQASLERRYGTLIKEPGGSIDASFIKGAKDRHFNSQLNSYASTAQQLIDMYVKAMESFNATGSGRDQAAMQTAEMALRKLRSDVQNLPSMSSTLLGRVGLTSDDLRPEVTPLLGKIDDVLIRKQPPSQSESTQTEPVQKKRSLTGDLKATNEALINTGKAALDYMVVNPAVSTYDYITGE